MADRGQITGGLRRRPARLRQRDQPEAAATEKGIVSPVAGQADILLVPDLEAGNMLAKQLTYLAGADAAGDRARRAGADRADQPGGQRRTRLASCAVAVLLARAKAAGGGAAGTAQGPSIPSSNSAG